MKKNYILAALFLGILSEAQILTNSIPVAAITDSNVILDASSNYSIEAGETNNKHKGIVIPSVDLINFEFNLAFVSDATFPTYFDGMIVYNRSTGTTITTGNRSSTATEVKPGFYYFYNPNGYNNRNVTGGQWRAMGNAYTGSSSVVLNGNSFERAALTGDVTAAANSNTTTISADAINSGKILDETVANADLASGTGGIYKGSGSLSGNTIVTQGSSTLAFTSTATNAFSVDGTTLSVDAANNRIGIGTAAPATALEVNGAATNSTSYTTTGTNIDFSGSNIATTSNTGTSIILTGIKDGGAYTLVLTSTAATGTLAFTAPGFTFKYMGTSSRTSGKTHIYSFIVVGATVFVTMATEN